MAEYVESKEKSQKAALEAQKAKLQALEKQLGIDTPSSGAMSIGAASGSGTSSAPAGPSSGVKQADVDVAKIAQKRHRFDDTQYLETSREINDGVRNAVAAGEYRNPFGNVYTGLFIHSNPISVTGLLKKRKKAKTESSPAVDKAPAKAAVPAPASSVAANA